MDKQIIIQKLQDVFKTLTREIYYLEDNDHQVRIVSHSFKGMPIADRLKKIMELVRSNPEMLNLDLKYDFTFVPMTPNEIKNINDVNFESEIDEMNVFEKIGDVAKSPEV